MALVKKVDLHSLSDFFANPEHSPSCARCILGASIKGIIQGQDLVGPKTFWANFTQDLEFWRFQVRFLFAVCTEEETRQLLSRLDRCSCQMRDRRILAYHQAGRVVEEQLWTRTCVDGQKPAMLLIARLFCQLSTVLGLSHVKSVAKRTNAKWPTCPEDLMPFGPENLVKSFTMWIRIIPDHIVISVATQCITLCGSLLTPSAIDSDLTLDIVEAGRRFFDRTWETIRLRAESRRQAMGEAFPGQVRALMQYFFDFFYPSSIKQQAAVLDGCEMKTVQMFSLLVYVASDPRLCIYIEPSQDFRYNLADHGLTLYHSMRLYINPLPPVLAHPVLCQLYDTSYPEDENERGQEASADEDDKKQSGENQGKDEDEEEMDVESLLSTLQSYGLSASDVYHKLRSDSRLSNYTDIAHSTIDYVRKARSTLYCSTHDCPNSIHSTGPQFRRCVGCKVALYCSKKCQSDAWNAEQHPHKIVCKILQKMIAVVGSDVLFRHLECEHSDFPTDLAVVVILKWLKESVSFSELFEVESCMTYKRVPPSVVSKTECLPGFDDYEEKLRELSEKYPITNAQYLTIRNKSLKPLRTGFENLKSSFQSENNAGLNRRMHTG